MIGIVIQTTDEVKERFNQLLFHKIGGKSILEHTIDNANLCTQSHKTFVLAPIKERRKIDDILFRKTPTSKLTIGRFQEDGETALDGLYKIANENGLQYVVRIFAHSPLLPPWLMSDFIYDYFASNNTGYCINQSVFHPFSIEIIPYWLLASAFSNLDGNERIRFDETFIIRSQKIMGFDTSLDLRWKSLEQNTLFEHLILGSKEYDLEDMIREVENGNKQEATEE